MTKKRQYMDRKARELRAAEQPVSHGPVPDWNAIMGKMRVSVSFDALTAKESVKALRTIERLVSDQLTDEHTSIEAYSRRVSCAVQIYCAEILTSELGVIRSLLEQSKWLGKR